MIYVANAFYLDTTYLEHHGILGMKWGVRRYQNKDGTLTAAGKRRAAQLEKKQQQNAEKSEYYAARRGKYAKKYEDLTTPNPKGKDAKTTESKVTSNKSTDSNKPEKKSVFDMSEAELRSEVNRLDLIKKYNTYMEELHNPKQATPKQRKRLVNGEQVVSDILTKSLTSVGTKFIQQNLEKALGIKGGDEEKKKKKNNNN